ncbi:MAG: hypothetical protein WCO63_01475 [Bacteroidota bacterium]
MIFVLNWAFIAQGQSVSSIDSLKIVMATEKVFQVFKHPNMKDFRNISSTNVYCLICEEFKNSRQDSVIIDRDVFFSFYLDKINSSDFWKRASVSKERHILKESVYNQQYADYLVLITIWKENEYAQGHEGAQLGISFKKEGREFKFAGLETIP